MLFFDALVGPNISSTNRTICSDFWLLWGTIPKMVTLNTYFVPFISIVFMFQELMIASRSRQTLVNTQSEAWLDACGVWNHFYTGLILETKEEILTTDAFTDLHFPMCPSIVFFL